MEVALLVLENEVLPDGPECGIAVTLTVGGGKRKTLLLWRLARQDLQG